MKRISPICLAVALTVAPAAAEPVDYGVAYLHSWHIGPADLNDNTPGIGFGRRWQAQRPALEYHLEGGVFWNSYEEVSPLVLAGLTMQVAEIGPGSLRAGASLGVARYADLSVELEEIYGIPNIEGFIPIAALTASYRVNAYDVRLTTVPPGADVDAIFNLSVARAF
jgi:hypothetical protein